MTHIQHTIMTPSEKTHSPAAGDNDDTTLGILDHDMELKTFQYTDHNTLDTENDIDPDNNFFSTINNNCYYTDEQYNQTINTDNKLSIIHFNSRSMYANFSNIKDYLCQFIKPFNIIAISETRINVDKGVDFELDGYELSYINRENKSGGGVAVYVDISLNYRVVQNMSTATDNLFECITIEICKEKNKNVIISCIYRAPGANTELFSNWIEASFARMNQKVVFICGDINIDLPNPNEHKLTDKFINTMYSLSSFKQFFYPKITRPSRITSHSSTIIDNIFTNDTENNTVSRLLINDISDHLPVFTVCNF
ncbi:hypothetical protein ABVT39_005135 [Epinephelus coioides]